MKSRCALQAWPIFLPLDPVEATATLLMRATAQLVPLAWNNECFYVSKLFEKVNVEIKFTISMIFIGQMELRDRR